MSHIDQINFIKKFKEFYINKNFNKNISILEIGSLDVNGSIRNLFDFASEYIGIDLEKGPNVDLVLNGTNIDKLNKSFDIIVSCECFEHAKDWKEIFKKMCQISKPNSFIVVSVASTGRVEHGTERSGNWQSPGNKDDYYLNLTKKHFINNFDLPKIFSNYFFFYNLNSYDLYFVGVKGFEENKSDINSIENELKILFKRKKLRKILVYAYSKLISENLRQNIFFMKKRLINKFMKK
ncbi:class I SAM-dependent methyltransferase [Candidatus Pelagibacter sp.]|nr:class I SAM-dependent methyltransferase [Candidatus Pelagibacter sp.]